MGISISIFPASPISQCRRAVSSTSHSAVQRRETSVAQQRQWHFYRLDGSGWISGRCARDRGTRSDLNNDRAVDLILTGWRRAAAVLTNPREGAFRQSEPWTSPFPEAPAGVVAFDFNKDGLMDLAFTHWSRPGLSLWKNVGGTRFERVEIPEPQWIRGWGITATDIDNDGWIDLAVVGERDAGGTGAIMLLRNLGDGHFADVTAAASLASVQLDRPRALVSADLDGDGDTDLLVTQNGGAPVVLKNNGGNRRSVGATRPSWAGGQSERNRLENRGIRRGIAPEMGAAIVVGISGAEPAARS